MKVRAVPGPIRPCAYKRPGDPGYSHVPVPGPEQLSAEAIAAWVAADPERAALHPKVQRALAYIDQFRPPS